MMKPSCDCRLCTTHGCHCDEYASFFTLLGNSARIHIINALRTGRKNVSEICELAGCEQTSASHNLRKLRGAGFVTSEQDGKYVYYSLTRQTEELMDMIDRHVKEHEIITIP